MIQKFKIGEIRLAKLNPNRGREPGKTRPVLIVQDQGLLDLNHPTTIVLPLTPQLIDDAEPLRIRIKAQNQLKQDSDILIDQIQAVDNQRVMDDVLALCYPLTMQQVHRAIQEVIGIMVHSPQKRREISEEIAVYLLE